MKLNAFKVFEVATPKNPGHWMGKALTAYLNVGYYLGLAEYVKNSTADVANPNTSIKDMFVKTTIRTVLFPVSMATAPVRAAGYLLDNLVDEKEKKETTDDTVEVEIVTTEEE